MFDTKGLVVRITMGEICTLSVIYRRVRDIFTLSELECDVAMRLCGV